MSPAVPRHGLSRRVCWRGKSGHNDKDFCFHTDTYWSRSENSPPNEIYNVLVPIKKAFFLFLVLLPGVSLFFGKPFFPQLLPKPEIQQMGMMKMKGAEDRAGFHVHHTSHPLAVGIGGTEISLTRLAWKVPVVPLMDIKEDWDGCWFAYLVSFYVSFIIFENSRAGSVFTKTRGLGKSTKSHKCI